MRLNHVTAWGQQEEAGVPRATACVFFASAAQASRLSSQGHQDALHPTDTSLRGRPTAHSPVEQYADKYLALTRTSKTRIMSGARRKSGAGTQARTTCPERITCKRSSSCSRSTVLQGRVGRHGAPITLEGWPDQRSPPCSATRAGFYARKHLFQFVPCGLKRAQRHLVCTVPQNSHHLKTVYQFSIAACISLQPLLTAAHEQ